VTTEVEQRHPFWAHMRQTVLGEGVGLFLSILILPFAARRFDEVSFSRYVVAFRVLALLQPTALLGLGVALTRALAATPARAVKKDAPGVVAGATLPVLGAVAAVSAAVLVMPAQLGRLVFGHGDTKAVLFAFIPLLLGSCVFTLASSALRGVFAMTAANVLYPLYLGVVPLTALALTDRVAPALGLIGAGWIALSVAFTARYISGPLHDVIGRARSLLSYGLPRVPGELALFGLLSVPSIAAVRADGVVAGGRVALAMSLVTMGGAVCTPLASALLPHASRAMNEPAELSELARLVRTLVARLIPLLVLGSALVAAVAPVALRIGLGAEYESAATSIRLACVAVPAYGLYICLRSVLDAAFHRPVTMIYALYALVVFAGAFAVLQAANQDNAVMLAFAAGVWALALLVGRRTRILFRDAS
jgi:O-antigen/teichoic acid export membrane protein